MLGFIKRIRHRGEDIDDLRSHVLGERFTPDIGPGTQPEPFAPAPLQTGRQPLQPSPYQQPFAAPAEPEPAPRLESRYGEESAFGFPSGEQQAGRAAENVNRDYDIIDRLNLIESQLAAVRSMTETINERLKNMDAKLGARRY